MTLTLPVANSLFLHYPIMRAGTVIVLAGLALIAAASGASAQLDEDFTQDFASSDSHANECLCICQASRLKQRVSDELGLKQGVSMRNAVDCQKQDA